MALPTIDFRSIREHHGSKNRGFEELVTELIPSLHDEVKGLNVVRHGNPDSGVEAYVELEDGTIWGWQAKYFFAIGNDQLRQMRESLDTALASLPTLSGYTFVLPMNLPAGTHGKSAKTKLEESFAEWASQAAEKGRTIDIRFVGESQLINALIREENVGHVFYWFDKRLLFSDSWLQKRYKQAKNKAGPRYREEVNVEVPIRFAFEGLGLTESFERELSGRINTFARAIRSWQRLPDDIDLGSDFEPEVRSVVSTAEEFLASWQVPLAATGVTPNWKPFHATISDLQHWLDRLLEKLYDHEPNGSDRDQAASIATARGSDELVADFRFKAEEIYRATIRVEEFIDSAVSRLASDRALFLTGEWGTGKTHLLCDVAAQRLAEGRPTVLLLGEELDDTSPRDSILALLDLSGLTMSEFLATLDAAGRVSGCKALLLLDAVNDVPGRQQIRGFLGGLAAEAREYSHLAVAVSCRSSYVSEVLPRLPGGSRPEDFGFQEIEHTGFAGLEFEAATAFFNHWGLEIPDFPLLLPEYSNPLFLTLLCTTLRLRGQKALPRGSTGVTELFSGYLSAVNHLLADSTRCDFRPDKDLVGKVVRRVAESMIKENVEHVPTEEFEELCEELLPNRSWSSSLGKGLIDESVVVRDLRKEGEVVRLSYQRLGDHLQAEWLLDVMSDEDLESRVIDLANKTGSFRQSSGLLEALAVQLPENRSYELFELVDNPQHPAVQSAVLRSLAWRKPQNCAGEALSRYLNSIASSRPDIHDQVLESRLQQAFHPDHPFNARTLDELLRHMKLPQRDAYWTIHINGFDPRKSAIYRIINWAMSPLQESSSDGVAWLASLTLTWCLAASNRGLRDQATKALVCLLRRRVPVLIHLVHHFREVDDPYVSERLLAVAYGCALASSDDRQLLELAECVYGRVFSGGAPEPDVMLRDYARGVIECAVHRGASSSNLDPKSFQPPYRSSWPVRIPSKDALEFRAPRATHGHLWFSLGELGDFNRYEVAPAVRQFVAPNQRRRRQERRERFKSRASAGQAKSLTNPQFDEILSRLGRLARTQPDPELNTPIMWNSDEASRWILRRVLELGWTSKRFGEYDDSVATHDRYAPLDRTERIGKKYQWIALHELSARIADHARYLPRYDDDADHFDGPWQISLRDIDPSLTIHPHGHGGDDRQTVWWRPLAAHVGPFDDDVKRTHWLQGDRDALQDSDLQTLLSVREPEDSKWLTLFAMYSWEEAPSVQNAAAMSDRGDQWLQIRSYLIPRSSHREFWDWAVMQDWFGRWMPEGASVLDIYLGEWSWHPAAAEYPDSPCQIEGRGEQIGIAPAHVLPTWAEFTWEGDATFDRPVHRAVPAKGLMSHANLRWSPPHTSFAGLDRELVARDASSEEIGPSSLVVGDNQLRAFLDQHNFSLIWTMLGGRNVRAEQPREHPILSISGVGGLESADSSIQVSLRTQLH